METKLIFLFEPEQWRYWRESKLSVEVTDANRHTLVEHTATMAYSLDADGRTVRVWWLFPENSFLDGVDPPREHQTLPFVFVHPGNIKLNESSGPWLPTKDPTRLHTRLEQRPERLLRRWAQWTYANGPRVVLPEPEVVPEPTRLERLKAWWRR